jgi:hypothetical protein
MANALNEFFITAASSIVDQIPPTDKPPDSDPEPEILPTHSSVLQILL